MDTNQEDTMRNQVYLAALLHDIGKFYQRADKPFSEKQSELSPYSIELANDICPINDQGRFGYQHVVWTNEFLISNQAIFDKIPGLKGNKWLHDPTVEDNLANFACNHHRPKTQNQALITLGDWWSAGIDRTQPNTMEVDAKKEDTIEWGRARNKKIPLSSIFNELKNGKYSNAHPLRPLSIDTGSPIFPHQVKTIENGNSEYDYFSLWNEFMQEFKLLPTGSFHGFTESLLYLLKKYTWCIPSNTMDMANVSLYDHLKTTAAFTDCLYVFSRNNPEALDWEKTSARLSFKEGSYPVLLFGGDLSGIQKFIYNISSRGAAKSLKGRSFYLQLLIDSVIQKILKHPGINCNICNIIFSSGGRFYLLLPNTTEVKEAIDELREEIDRWLWNEHEGRLSLNFDYIEFVYQNNQIKTPDTQGNDLGTLWDSLNSRLNFRKSRKFESLLRTNYEMLFTTEQTGGEVKVCSVTGIELAKGEYVKVKHGKTEQDSFISKMVNDQIRLGEILKDVDYVITNKEHQEGSDYLESRAKDKICIAGISNYLFDESDMISSGESSGRISSADLTMVKRINNLDFLNTRIKGQKSSYAFQFYGGNKQAMKQNGSNKTFEEITETIEGDDKSETYLAILRMDVDDLGKLFIDGFSNTSKSFSAYSTLSFMLDVFFSGYLNTIREKYADHVNIIYSGGDDVFIAGRWDSILALAEDIRNEFRRFTGRNDITISAGVAIISNKFPISKAAEMAGNAEQAAKNNKLNLKNSIDFFSNTVSWGDEFDQVKRYKNDFVHLINQYGMSKIILHRLILLNSKRIESLDKTSIQSSTTGLSYVWHTAYYLRRFADRYKGTPEILHFIENSLIKELFVSGSNFQKIALAARWAELELKEEVS